MSVRILRPKGLGLSSVSGIVEKMTTPTEAIRGDKQPVVGPMGDGIVIRWGYTGKALVKQGATVKVVNPADAIKETSDKGGFRLTLYDNGLAPMTWGSIDSFYADAGDFPVVVRPSRHKQGKDFYLCDEPQDLEAAATEIFQKTGEYSYYISEYIKKDREFRVVVAQGRVVYVYEKIPEDAEAGAWNHAWGSEAPNVKWGQWPKAVCWIAIEAMKCSGLDFGAVDVILKNDPNNPDDPDVYVLEINTAPETTSEYRQTCLAKVFDSIAQKPEVKSFGYSNDEGWRGFIHPAISSSASSL